MEREGVAGVMNIHDLEVTGITDIGIEHFRIPGAPILKPGEKAIATYWQEQRAIYEAQEAAIQITLEQGDLPETYREHYTEWLAEFPRAYELIDAQIENTLAERSVDSPLQHFNHDGLYPTAPPLPLKASELSPNNYDNEIYQTNFHVINAIHLLKNNGLLNDDLKSKVEIFDHLAGLPLAPRPILEEMESEWAEIFDTLWGTVVEKLYPRARTATEPAPCPQKDAQQKILRLSVPQTLLLRLPSQ